MKLVVAAAILSHGRLLAAQRSAPPQLAGMWELPGGKVEPGEDPVDALHREIAEELGVRVNLGEPVPAPDGGDWPILRGMTMRVWLASLASGTPEALQDHAQLAWVPLDDLASVRWLGPDVPIVREVGARAIRAMD